MDVSDLKNLLNNTDGFNQGTWYYFIKYSKDSKTINPNDFDEIVKDFCDDNGFDCPSKFEIESMSSIQQKDNFGFGYNFGAIASIGGFVFDNDKVIMQCLTLEEYRAKFMTVLKIIIKKLE
jgi:hypothetical protein